MTKEEVFIRRPAPQECWPKDAKLPVPFFWLIEACSNENFWAEIKQKCVALNERRWASNIVDLSEQPECLPEIRKSIQRALEAKIVWLEPPEDSLTAPSPQEKTG